MAATAWPFIVHDASGVAFIEGSRMKVLDVALDHLAYGWNAEQIHRQHPQLSMPQIHAALGYYHDHSDECDRQIAERRKRTDAMLANIGNPALQHRLASLKAAR
jgi:uncharacterized protein (DUF433 family)